MLLLHFHLDRVSPRFPLVLLWLIASASQLLANEPRGGSQPTRAKAAPGGTLAAPAKTSPEAEQLALGWADNLLTIRGPNLAGGEMKIWYIEAYCRPGSTDRDWRETVIGHKTRLVSAAQDGRRLELECTLKDGVIVKHVITSTHDEVDFRITATNPTDQASQAHWAQPCIRVDKFTGCEPKAKGQEAYLPYSFIFVDGRQARMPVEPWATKARYMPGQVWCPRHVDRNDVNPRPLSTLVPSNGLIGCYSADGSQIMATAFEPYQELFQGVIVCLHSDFRIGGLKPRETKQIRGKLYLVNADVDALLKRYARDFPEHIENQPAKSP
jgi:hypothetical protein